MFFLSVLDAVLAATTLTLRYSAILFVRFYPISRYLPRIYTNFTVYTLLAMLQACLTRRYASKRPRSAVLVILLGWMEISKPILSAVTALVNILCVASAIDFVYRGQYFHPSHESYFSRMGYVDATSARIVLRAPQSSAIELYVRPELATADNGVPTFIRELSDDADWVGTFTLENLLPDTAYIYTTNASHVGSFKTLEEHPKKWSMIQTSCIKPFYPYNPFDHALSVKGLEHLGRYLNNSTASFMLFLGDFIYIDLPYPLGWTQRHYTDLYRQTYASPSWTPQLRALPWLHVYDDHEFVNDWSGNETGLYQAAVVPYWDYQGQANPPSPFGTGASYYTFTRGDIAFFVLDTRRYRSPSDQVDGPHKTMLGHAQREHLRQWLQDEPRWKVVVSSVPWTRTWVSQDQTDRWAGYLHEREILFDWMRETDGVLLLSGDRHEHTTTLFPSASGEGKTLIEFSTSALNQFYEPFDRFHVPIVGQDKAVYNHYTGNSKFASLSFDTTDPLSWTIKFDLIVDGEKVWDYGWVYKREHQSFYNIDEHHR
ncbi:Metallo-dependent phosphatase [Periconia macrospinosa]|uniref:Metallo-dependent phosphatase n=1 Tax=Periconia macrospinosa TaxID=97972 RepID=A0A2V1DHE8_9PLEO|nr:Metallo-dependent phosphatase [Periconia macrospinosa]